MATTVPAPVTLETLIVVKILFRGQTKKFKLPLKDLGAHVLPSKLQSILGIPDGQDVVLERYSDSAAAYVTLKTDEPQVYKTLYRAAKAKLKLRLKASIPGEVWDTPAPPPPAPAPENLPNPLPSLHRMSSCTLATQPDAPISPAIAQSTWAGHTVHKFKSVNVSPPKPDESEGEAPVPQSFAALFDNNNSNAAAKSDAGLAFRPKPSSACTSWVVYCNNCNHPMEDDHFHCSVCDGGDYDLCPACVGSGIHCPGQDHWMVKRFVKNGCVINSTTQRIPPKVKSENHQEIPESCAEEKPSLELEQPTRTCNCCIKVLPEKDFVTCEACDDYDLCLDCHISNRHGHHPGHVFQAATQDSILPTLADFLCNSGRNVRHAAVCDGCDKFIYGVRHKCLNCPDWDYCSECIKNAKMIHPRHRFVPVYEPLAEPLNSGNRHYGIYCDGPLCKDKENMSYIEGTRFKCAVCHDTDFCQNCEAHPSNAHNNTHPLIKFKTPVRSVSVTTVNDDKTNQIMARLGDRILHSPPTAIDTTPAAPSINAATQVHTIVDLKPSENVQVKKEKIAIQDLLADTVEPVQAKALRTASTQPIDIPISRSETAWHGLDGHFIRDTIVDGSKIYSGFQFVQIWTMRNPGPGPWPAGCSVRHVGGDNMLNIDNTRPLSHTELAKASESNTISRIVEAGEEVSFRVVMKAPLREGTAISYWRLKTAEGMPFGHRLWCDIRVVSPPTPVAPMTAPATLSAAATFPSDLYQRLLQTRRERLNLAQTAAQQTAEHCRVKARPAYRSIDAKEYHATMRAINEAKERRRRESLHQTPEQDRINEEPSMPSTTKGCLDTMQAQVEAQERIFKQATEYFVKKQRSQREAALAAVKHEESAPESAATSSEPTQEEAAEPAPKPQSSGMIFPHLDKESPESSSCETSTTAQPESPVSQKSAVACTVTVGSNDEFFEDAESVTLHSDEEGFMTEEEYDILDASDEEAI